MKAIKLTEEHQNKLLEMCKALFPELEKKAQKGYKEWRKSHTEEGLGRVDGFWINGAGMVMCSYPIDYDYHKHLLGTRSECSIHWFEFCMTHLVTKLRSCNYVPEQTPKQLNEEYFHRKMAFYNFYWDVSNHQMTQTHPIDYLYEEFKKLS